MLLIFPTVCMGLYIGFGCLFKGLSCSLLGAQTAGKSRAFCDGINTLGNFFSCFSSFFLRDPLHECSCDVFEQA